VSAKKVLFILHNHPSVQPGGSEAYTLNIYETLRRSGEFEPMIVARVDARHGEDQARAGSRFTPLPEDPNQYLVEVESEGYDHHLQTFRDKSLYTRDFADFLAAHRPDVVHFQHHLHIGCDLISQIRRSLPATPIVYTLHEYIPICSHYGQLIRTMGNQLCLEASPRRCNECFPQTSHQDFFLRERFIKSHFSEVDLFIAPSRFLLERYVDWGISRERIRHVDHGFPPVTRLDDGEPRPRTNFAFFGVLTPFKGINVLVRAMERLGPDFEGRMSIHGSGMVQMRDESEVVQQEIDRVLATTPTVTYCGPYDHDAAMPRLMAQTDWVVVPSIWWENSPLVISEAFQYGRPIICSDIGGMAEKVTHEVNGLHFNVGNPASLAATIHRAATTPGLWERLQAGIPPVPDIGQHVATLSEIYRTLIERRASAPAHRSRVAGARRMRPLRW
jgi:glycosyltransferase involved in cell wall biosynthesis